MKKVTTIHLNGRAYQVDEEAHAALAAYLDKAAAALADNPDKDEILADFENAIAEKCSVYITSSKNVISHKEIEKIISEMGPVSGENTTAGEKTEGTETGSEKTTSSPKRLYRIREGAVIAGVCNGIAAYFNIDVVLVRVAFVVLTIISHGAGLLIYFIMMMIVPRADTGVERAQARGTHFSAHDLIEQAKKNYAEYKGDKSGWKQHMREQRKYWKYKAKIAMHESRRAAKRESHVAEAITGMIWFAVIIGGFVLLYRHVPFFHYNLDKLGHYLTTELNDAWK